MNQPNLSLVDHQVADYLQYRGMHELAKEFRQESRTIPQAPEPMKISNMLISLVKQQKIDDLLEQFVKINKLYITASNVSNPFLRIKCEILKSCLAGFIPKQQKKFEQFLSQLVNEYPLFFNDFAALSLQNIQKNPIILQYQSDIMLLQLENQLKNILNYAFANHKLPQLYQVLQTDYEKEALNADVMVVKNLIEVQVSMIENQ